MNRKFLIRKRSKQLALMPSDITFFSMHPQPARHRLRYFLMELIILCHQAQLVGLSMLDLILYLDSKTALSISSNYP